MAIEITKAGDDNKAWIGYSIMLIIFILAIYIGIKHYKSPGFWWGFLVMFLLSIKISTGQNWSFDSPILSLSNNIKN